MRDDREAVPTRARVLQVREAEGGERRPSRGARGAATEREEDGEGGDEGGHESRGEEEPLSDTSTVSRYVASA